MPEIAPKLNRRRTNQFVMERDAAITSVKYANPIRLEIPIDSPLPGKLKELGYDLIFQERASRLGGNAAPTYNARWRNGVASAGYGFTTVDIFSVQLPK